MISPVSAILARVVEEVRDDCSGEALDYLPEFREVDPDQLGICVATIDGHVYEEGDTRSAFWIQSISKPFTYGLALADQGVEAVDAKIDLEPSGDSYNEISLDPVTSKPRNPMINAGAITAASLIAGESTDERFARVLALYSAFAGHELSVDEAVFSAEFSTGHRNRAIGNLLRWGEIIEDDPEPALELYTRQCSVRVDCHDLSLMAATLANGGINPRTGEEVLSTEVVERVLSVMTTCGMYDGAGTWVAGVGMPAKSGVGGGIIAVLPGQVGMAVFSPRLNDRGNSVRGVAASRALSRELELHLMHVGRGAKTAVRASYDVRAVPSLRRRSEQEQEVLQRVGGRARVFELHGDLLFAGAESVVRAVCDATSEVDLVVLDVRRVDDVAQVARRMLGELRAALRADGKDGAAVDPDEFLGDPEGGPAAEAPNFRNRDAAVAWCEDWLIERYGEPDTQPESLELSAHPFLAELDDEAVEIVEAKATAERFSEGEVILRAGEPCGGLHLITSGQVRVSVPRSDGNPGQRITTLSAGMTLGERALSSGEDQSTDAVADNDVTLSLLSTDTLDHLQREHPQVALALWRTMAHDAHTILSRFAEDIAARSEAAT